MVPDITPLTRLDSFPYRHRLSEVMATPAVIAGESMTVATACACMDEAKVSSLVVVDADGAAVGMVTERDVLRVLSRSGINGLNLPLSEVMTRPVHTVPGDAFLYLGIARMNRLGLRHLVVVDDAGRPLGVVTGRALLQVRASQALVIGDDVAEAATAADLGRAHRALPALAAGLRAEGVSARQIAAVVSTVVRDVTSRAAEMVEATLAAEGWGGPPARWALLILGSAGRGESLLAFDQDNAIVHTGDAAADGWFAEFGRRLNDLLNDIGIPFCHGDVMARNPAWRRTFDGWRAEIGRWVFQPEVQTVMNVDIFFDFVCVHGDRALADELHRFALDTARRSAFFLQFLTINVARLEVPIGLFGRFVTQEGRLDAKKYGLLPLVSAARARALRAGIVATSTADRYTALEAAGLMHRDDLAGLLNAHETILGVMLDQQLADIAAGVAPSSRIEPRRLPAAAQRRLRDAFQRIRVLKTLIGSLMAA